MLIYVKCRSFRLTIRNVNSKTIGALMLIFISFRLTIRNVNVENYEGEFEEQLSFRLTIRNVNCVWLSIVCLPSFVLD